MGHYKLTFKFSELPQPLAVQGGMKLSIQTGEGIVTAILPAKVWKKLEQTATDYPQWVAALSGALDQIREGEILLKHAILQVFEKKQKPSAESTDSPLVASPQAATAPASAAAERGALVAEETIEHFAAQSRRVLDDPDLRRRLGEEGRTYAREWTAQGPAQALLEFYREFIPAPYAA